MSLILSKISENLEDLKKDNPDYDIYAEFVGRYGFENAAEVYDFLKSETGRETLGEIEKKLAEKIEQIEKHYSNHYGPSCPVCFLQFRKGKTNIFFKLIKYYFTTNYYLRLFTK